VPSHCVPTSRDRRKATAFSPLKHRLYRSAGVTPIPLRKPRSAVPFPWKPVTYHDHLYRLDHLHDREVKVRLSDAGPSITCTVKFSFHCFTTHSGDDVTGGAREDRPVFVDGDSNEQKRVFCPQRWAWSHWLPGIFERLGSFRSLNLRQNYNLAIVQKVGPSRPYVVYFDAGMIRVPEHRTVIQVNSAFRRPDPPDVSAAPRFSHVLRDALNSSKRPGAK